MLFHFLVPCVKACKRNIVATVNLDCRLDLKTIALHARNAEYNPKVLYHHWYNFFLKFCAQVKLIILSFSVSLR